MPIYAFKCRACGHSFEKSMTLAERESAPVTCPACGSDQVERVLSAFFAKTSRKS
jgi:putative FmdB family regulatory protein